MSKIINYEITTITEGYNIFLLWNSCFIDVLCLGFYVSENEYGSRIRLRVNERVFVNIIVYIYIFSFPRRCLHAIWKRN